MKLKVGGLVMGKGLLTGFAVLPFGLLALPTAHQGAPAAPPVAKVSFGGQVVPILKAHCVSCHTGKGASAGLDLTSRAGILKGGISGPLLVPGDPAKSLLIVRSKGLGGKPQMPLGFPAIPKSQIAVLERWVREGAQFDQAKAAIHWAYVAPKRPALPNVGSPAWVRNPVDAFVAQKLRKVGLSPNAEADRVTLARRVSLDLIGLPPTPEELDAYLADQRSGAYERLVDRLLASPHYGERQARIWLDLSRYADSDGYEKDRNRTAFKYRDWLIEAFNRNLPYDRFVIEQMAGDLIPEGGLAAKVATGFHRNTMHNLEGGVDQEEAHHNVILDRVDTTATVFLGSTLACARCHDHKYDPFSQKDYYRFAAFFGNTRVLPRGPKEISEEKWYEPEIKVPSPAQALYRRTLEARVLAAPNVMEAKQELAKLDAEIPVARVLEEVPTTKPLTYYVRHRGEFLSKTEVVEAAAPSALPPLPAGVRADRLALGKWMVSPANPLTARVQVNRMWEALFGRGLVETLEDFGTRAPRPTHPELLDWLATELMARKWDLKALQRLLVTSATYRQASSAIAVKVAKDPENLLLSRGPRFRLEAEAIRDTALVASGLLNPKVGGPSVYPLQPAGIWDTPYNGEQWTTSRDRDRYRRGLYTFWKRTAPYPSFMAFDGVSREACVVRRTRTNTPLQALALLNDPMMMDASAALGRRMSARRGALAQRLGWGFRCATSRVPSAKEVQTLVTLWTRVQERERAKVGNVNAVSPEQVAWTMVGNVLLNLDETITKG